MKSADLTVNDENQDVCLLERSTKTFSEPNENHSSKSNSAPPKKKSALLSRVSYDNVYSKKPIFRRKLIEKYSTARYNFNTKLIHNSPPFVKKKVKRLNVFDKSKKLGADVVGDVFSCKSILSNSKKSLSLANTTKSFKECRFISADGKVRLNPTVKLVPLSQIPDRIKNGKSSFSSLSNNLSLHSDCKLLPSSPGNGEISCSSKSTLSLQNVDSIPLEDVNSDRRASVSLSIRSEKCALHNSESSKNCQTAVSPFNPCEESNSSESAVSVRSIDLAVSLDGDSDSRASLSSNVYPEELSYELSCPKQIDRAVRVPCSKSSQNVDSLQHKDVEESSAKPVDSDSHSALKSDALLINSKKSAVSNLTGSKIISDSDSDSGLQLCSSDGEKSDPDLRKIDNQEDDTLPLSLLPKSVGKSCKHLLSLEKTNDWVNYSSQTSSPLIPNSDSISEALSIKNNLSISPPLCSSGTSAGISVSDSEITANCLSSNKVSRNLPVDDVSSSATIQLSSDVREKVETDKRINGSGIICSEPNADSKNQKCDDLQPNLLDNKDLESLNSNQADNVNCAEITVQSDDGKKTSEGQSLSSHNSAIDDLTNFKKTTERWKLVPMSIYQYLSEVYESKKIDNEVPAAPSPVASTPAAPVVRKRKNKGWTRYPAQKRKQVQKDFVKIFQPNISDPYVNIWNESVTENKSTDNSVTENVGMILHMGVNRPLFPEIYRNIIALNDRNDGKITDLWANFSLSTLVTNKTDTRFRSIFLPVKDGKLKATIDNHQDKTSYKFQEVDLQKVTIIKKVPADNSNDPSSEKDIPNARKRKNEDSIDESGSKKQWVQKFYKVDFPSYMHPTLDAFGKSGSISNVNPVEKASRTKKLSDKVSPVERGASRTKKLSDEALLAEFGFKPCWVVLKRVQIPYINANVEIVDDDSEDEEEDIFFGTNHCSRTFGQMIDYRSRNHSLVFFHRIKRILRLQRQNNKLFQSCRYVRLRPDLKDEFEIVDILDDSLVPSLPFPIEVSKNPLEILKTWKLNLFEAPLLKGTDVNAHSFPIRFMNHALLKSEKNAKWFILQLNKTVLTIIHHGKDCLPVELLFQIICRADLTKKVVCNTIGFDFDPDTLTFGVYGIPGLCEAVVIGPYEAEDAQHDLTAVVQLWNGETATIPITEMNFDRDSFFLWNEDSKMRNVYGLWWKPGDIVTCTSTANSVFMNHLFDPAESPPDVDSRIKLHSLMKDHPFLSYSKYYRTSGDINFTLMHQTSKLTYTTSGLKVSERMAIVDFTPDDSPLLLPSKLRSRSKMPNYCEMAGKKESSERKAVRTAIRVASRHKFSRIKVDQNERNQSERIRRKVFHTHRFALSSAVDASNEESLFSVLNKAVVLIKNMEKENATLSNTKRKLLFIRKHLFNKLKACIKHFPATHPYYRRSFKLISQFHSCNRAEVFTRNEYPKLTVSSSSYDNGYSDSMDSDEVKPETSAKNKICRSGSTKNSKLIGKRNIKKCVWRKMVDRSFEAHRVSESSENCSSTDEKLRAEHSYCSRKSSGKYNNDLERSIDAASPSLLYNRRKLPPQATAQSAVPPSVVVHIGPAPNELKNKCTDQVAVYLTENDQPITKLVIQRLKSVNENSAYLSSADRRNRVITSIRNIVNEVVVRTSAEHSKAGVEERSLVPRLLLLQRMLEDVNMQVRDCSKIRLVDQTIEIDDDNDKNGFDEFSIEPMPAADDIRPSDPRFKTANRRVFVKVTVAPTQPKPEENGVSLMQSASESSSQPEEAITELKNDGVSVVDDQLSVEKQIFLNSAGDQVDYNNLIDNPAMSSSPAVSRKTKDRLSAGVQRRVTLLKRVNGANPNGADLAGVNPPPETASQDPFRPIASSEEDIGAVNRASPQRSILTKSSNMQFVRLHRPALKGPVRMVAKKSYSNPNVLKLLVQRRTDLAIRPQSAGSNGASSDTTSAIANDSGTVTVSLDDILNIHPDQLGKPISPEKPTVGKFRPNIIMKNRELRGPARNVMVIPLVGKKISVVPVKVVSPVPVKERIRCPSFVPPSLHCHSPSSAIIEEEVIYENVASPSQEDFVDQLYDDVKTKKVDDCVASLVHERGESEEQPGSRRSSIDSSSRLMVKSFASVHSFDDNCFTNMDRLLNG